MPWGGQGRHQEAEVAFRRALELKEDDPEAHYGLGVVLGGQQGFRIMGSPE